MFSWANTFIEAGTFLKFMPRKGLQNLNYIFINLFILSKHFLLFLK